MMKNICCIFFLATDAHNVFNTEFSSWPAKAIISVGQDHLPSIFHDVAFNNIRCDEKMHSSPRCSEVTGYDTAKLPGGID